MIQRKKNLLEKCTSQVTARWNARNSQKSSVSTFTNRKICAKKIEGKSISTKPSYWTCGNWKKKKKNSQHLEKHQYSTSGRKKKTYRMDLKSNKVPEQFNKPYGTCSGLRSKTLPPIVKETLGIEDKLAQSTADSPIGLGSRSQSCNYNWLWASINCNKWGTRKKKKKKKN